MLKQLQPSVSEESLYKKILQLIYVADYHGVKLDVKRFTNLHATYSYVRGELLKDWANRLVNIQREKDAREQAERLSMGCHTMKFQFIDYNPLDFMGEASIRVDWDTEQVPDHPCYNPTERLERIARHYER